MRAPATKKHPKTIIVNPSKPGVPVPSITSSHTALSNINGANPDPLSSNPGSINGSFINHAVFTRKAPKTNNDDSIHSQVILQIVMI